MTSSNMIKHGVFTFILSWLHPNYLLLNKLSHIIQSVNTLYIHKYGTYKIYDTFYK